MTIPKINSKIIALLSVIGVLLACLLVQVTAQAQTALPNRSLQLSDSRTGQTNVRYRVSFSVPGAGYVLGSFTLLFCDNTPLIGQPCTPPIGFDVSSATIINQSGVGDFSIGPGATANSLLFTRTASFVGPTNIVVELSGVTNPANLGTYYGRLQTYSSEDATGTAVYEGGVTFAMTNPIDLQTVVPPYLYMCVAITVPGYNCVGATGNFIDFGELSSKQTSTGKSEFIVATNAGAGFVVYVTGISPTSGNNVIPGMNIRGPSAVGVSQFGMNLRDNSNPDIGVDPLGIGTGTITANYNVPNEFKYSSGDNLVLSNTTTADKKFTVAYIINVNQNQRPGVYNTTLLYTCLAQF